jgi:hypothetical protein
MCRRARLIARRLRLSRPGGDGYVRLGTARFAGAGNGDVQLWQKCRVAPAQIGSEGRSPKGSRRREEETRGIVGQSDWPHPGGIKGSVRPVPDVVDPVRHRHRPHRGGALAAVGADRLRLFFGRRFCLGIKAVFYVEMGENELRSRLAEQFDVQRLIEIEPARARKLIRDATLYAAGLGCPRPKTPRLSRQFLAT